MPNFIRSHQFPFIAACGVSVGLVLAGALLAQLLNLAACPLCIIQRMLYLLLGLAAGIGISVATHPVGRRVFAAVVAAIAATGLFVASYQVWLQRFARNAKCAVDSPWWEQLVDWAGERMPFLFQANGLCSDAAWKFLGLSIAEWSLMAFTSLMLLALFAAMRRDAA